MLQLLLVLMLVLAGGFFAGAETAFSNCNRVRMRTWADDGNRRAKRVLDILERFDKALITLLIGNNVIHVIASATAALLAIRLLGGTRGPVISTVVMTLLVFIFSETIPKSIAKANSDTFALDVSAVLYVLMVVLTPVSAFFMGLSSVLKRMFRSRGEEPSMTEEDFRSMIDSIEDEGILEEDEGDLIRSALEFTDAAVKDVLTPREKIVGINVSDPPEAVRAQVIDGTYSRLPVYYSSLSHIIGILNAKQYLQELMNAGDREIDIESLMVEPYFVSQDMELHTLMEEFRRRETHIAIAMDDEHRVVGLVTMEDLLNDLVGDIINEDASDETDPSAEVTQ